MTEPQDIFCKDKARAFNPFLCARSDKLKTLIREVQTQLEGVLPSCCWPIVKHWQPLDHAAISAV